MSNKLALKFTGSVKNSLFVPSNNELYLKGLSYYNNNNVELTLKKIIKKRSYNQNAYYWGVVIKMLSEHIGEKNRLKVHESLKFALGIRKCYFDLVNNKPFEMVVSTTKYSTTDFEEYLQRVRLFCNEHFALMIPLPNEIEIPEYYFIG